MILLYCSQDNVTRNCSEERAYGRTVKNIFVKPNNFCAPKKEENYFSSITYFDLMKWDK